MPVVLDQGAGAALENERDGNRGRQSKCSHERPLITGA
jgi:hypothetical protein